MSGDEIRWAKNRFLSSSVPGKRNDPAGHTVASTWSGWIFRLRMHALFGSTAHTVFPAIAGIRWNRLLNDQTASVIITMEAQQNIVTPREKATGK